MTFPRRWLQWGLVSGVLTVAATAVGSAQSLSPALLVVLETEKMLAIVDPASGKIVGRAPTDENPNGVAVTPDGKLAITANLRPGTLSVIDVASRKERRVNVGRRSQPNDILVSAGKSPSGEATTVFYFTARGYKAIGRYDPATNEVDWMGVGQNETHILAVTKDGNTLFASNRGSNSVAMLQGIQDPAALKWSVTNIPIPGSPDGVDLSPDGRQLWIGLQGGGGVVVLDVASKKIMPINVPLQKTSGEGSQAARLRVSFDGRRVFLLNRPTQELVVIDAAARKEIKRFKIAGQSLLVVPDGRTYVTVSDNGYIAVLDPKTLELGKLQTGGSPNAMAWAGK